MWYVYILKCKNNNLYTGITLDIKRRLHAHKAGKGAAYTRIFGVKKLVYTEKHSTQGNALRREARIKRMNRKNKLVLIKS